MEVRNTSKFKRDIKRVAKQNKDLSILDKAVITLAIPEPLDKPFNDHHLSGDWSGYNECHLAGDWLLIYCYEIADDDSTALVLARTGSHAELFE